MTKKIIIVISLAVAAILLLAACERSASQPLLATPTAAGTNSTPQPLGLLHLQDLGTQTAMYVQTEVALGVFTPVPTENLSLASPTQTPAGTESTPFLSHIATYGSCHSYADYRDNGHTCNCGTNRDAWPSSFLYDPCRRIPLLHRPPL
jgi:hypothetical protein